MSSYNKLLNNLEMLKLEKIKENIDNYIELINAKKKDVVESRVSYFNNRKKFIFC